jgi:hypothetical protein
MGGLLFSMTAVSSLGMATTYAAWGCNNGLYVTTSFSGTGTVQVAVEPSYWYGTIANGTTQTQTLVCPIINEVGAGIVSASFVAYDRNPTSDVVCKMAAEWASGNNFWREVVQGQTTGYGSQAQEISLGGIQAGYPYYTFGCYLPPISGGNYSHLVNYDIQEG